MVKVGTVGKCAFVAKFDRFVAKIHKSNDVYQVDKRKSFCEFAVEAVKLQ